MRASDYVKIAKVGDTILTERVGTYKGGFADVIEIAPDPAAPEILFNVEHPTQGVMGVFEQEHVYLLGDICRLPDDSGTYHRRCIEPVIDRKSKLLRRCRAPARKDSRWCSAHKDNHHA